MRKWYLLALITSLTMSSCTKLIFGGKEVECCEQQAQCCHEEMCCLVRYAKAAGKEPKVFTPEIPVYARPEDLEPEEGDLIIEPGFISRWNPFASKEGDLQELEEATAENLQDDDDSLFRSWLPF